MKSQAWRDVRSLKSDVSSATPWLQAFLKKLQRRLARMDVPLRVEAAGQYVGLVSHARRGRDLHPMEWEVIAHLGKEISKQYQLGVSWSGSSCPSCFVAVSDPPSRAWGLLGTPRARTHDS